MGKRSPVRGKIGDITLVRTSAHYLRIDGLTHQAKERWQTEPCGGNIRVEDFRPKGLRRDPYEIFCDKCSECYTDGCQTLEEILPAAIEWFGGETARPAEVTF